MRNLCNCRVILYQNTERLKTLLQHLETLTVAFSTLIVGETHIVFPLAYSAIFSFQSFLVLILGVEFFKNINHSRCNENMNKYLYLVRFYVSDGKIFHLNENGITNSLREEYTNSSRND